MACKNRKNTEKPLILASSSPRRREILASAGYKFSVVPSGAEELTEAANPGALVRGNALIKAREVASRPECAGQKVLGADTVVVLDGEVLGKPRDAAEAKRMLRALSGREHFVLTGYAVIYPGGEEKSGVCSTRVRFRELGGEEIDSYVATGEPLDKAGAYGIQERGAGLVESVDGDIDNVIGLPIGEIKKYL
ncbi:MAG: septum formation protein Maf [Clostridia bacterium]|nr:septum formation protein Maf [Clostridia bacterium]